MKNESNYFWFLPTGGDTRFLGKSPHTREASNEYFKQIATTAEQLGYDGLLIPTGSTNHDALITASTLANVTSKIKFLVAIRTASVGGPTVFARQASTLDQATNGRLLLNIVPGSSTEELEAEGVFLSHDERYRFADEFLDVFKSLYKENFVNYKGEFIEVKNANKRFPSVQKPYPKLFLGGSSDVSHELAAKHVDHYLSWGEPVHLISEKIKDVKSRAEKYGREVKFGIRLHVIVRETEDEAWKAADDLIKYLDDDIIKRSVENQKKSGSVGQNRMTNLHNGDKSKLVIAPNLWAGVGLVRGGAGTALVGNPENVVKRIKEYEEIGIDTFILSGYPHLEESIRFAELIFPLLTNKKSYLSKDEIVTGGAFDLNIANI